jgi:serine/threonine protein kinase
MQHERVEKVKQLLAMALARPPAEREAFLDAACANDRELRREIDVYLHSGDKTEQFNFNSQDQNFAIPHVSSEDLPTDPSIEVPNTDPSAKPFVTVSESDEAWIGKEFGKFIVQKRLAEGGLGIVYLATDSQLGRDVAVKILPGYFSMDRERLQRFHREARATSLLNHPNIVTVFELGQRDGCEFIVSEYVEGETLRRKMQKGPIPFVEMIKIVTQVAGALGAAHKAGIVHRDIKPENIMIRPDGYVKVLDFGLAKVTGANSKLVSGGGSNLTFDRTVPGMIMGTAAYISPEQAEGTDVDLRTDIWGLGVILYEMVAGKLPFEGPTASHMIVAILEHDPQPFDHPSAELKQIIATALQKDRSLRFQTADAMASALEELKHRLGYFSDQNVARSVKSDAREQTARPSPYRKLAWIVPSAFVVILLGALALFAAISFLRSSSASVSNSNSNVAFPSATPENNSVIIVASPTAEAKTPRPIFVEPTPIPSVKITPEKTPKIAVPTPERTPVRPRPTPSRKPKQDPNCVFTNTCN